MVIEEMTYHECRALLAETNLARLACAQNNQPYIVPVHVEFHDTFLYGFAGLGQKIEWMRENPLVCVEFDRLTTDRQWATVVVFGRYEELPDLPGNEFPRSVAVTLFQRHPIWWEPGSVSLVAHPPRPRILFRIVITRMTGRRGRPDAEEMPLPLSDPRDPSRQGWLAHVLGRVLGRDRTTRTAP
jgi:nitroimidazol reductase NimA-like FMN-containing flavoprotein (pyridoxamine 5'-phosphate oxidase superfamily)